MKTYQLTVDNQEYTVSIDYLTVTVSFGGEELFTIPSQNNTEEFLQTCINIYVKGSERGSRLILDGLKDYALTYAAKVAEEERGNK